MTREQIEKMECRKCLAAAKLENAIRNGIKQFHQEMFRQQLERPLEIKFFGRPL